MIAPASSSGQAPPGSPSRKPTITSKTMVDDERGIRNAACLFNRVFVLDPLYDSGALLYAAWHDPLIKDEHARRLAEHAGLLVRLAPLLNAGSASLAPDHLPGSWNPRP